MARVRWFKLVKDNQVVKNMVEEKEATVTDIYTRILLARVRYVSFTEACTTRVRVLSKFE